MAKENCKKLDCRAKADRKGIMMSYWDIDRLGKKLRMMAEGELSEVRVKTTDEHMVFARKVGCGVELCIWEDRYEK